MKYLDLSLTRPESNLALDEALLDEAEEKGHGEVLRFWESRQTFAVLGYSNKISTEVNGSFCRKEKIPILRRPSGGGTVLQGPGCLNYALILDIRKHAGLASITQTNHFVMEKNRRALETALKIPVHVQGITDLTTANLKFSGNAQRRKRNFVLFHGTFLLNFELERIQAALQLPEKRPCYRENRPHRDFVVNLEVAAAKIKTALRKEWGPCPKTLSWPKKRTAQLVAERYSLKSWNEKF